MSICAGCRDCGSSGEEFARFLFVPGTPTGCPVWMATLEVASKFGGLKLAVDDRRTTQSKGVRSTENHTSVRLHAGDRTRLFLHHQAACRAGSCWLGKALAHQVLSPVKLNRSWMCAHSIFVNRKLLFGLLIPVTSMTTQQAPAESSMSNC